jgi:hypothetical protein
LSHSGVFVFNNKGGRQKFGGFKREKNKLVALVMWIYGSDSLEEGAPLTTQERRAYLSHAYRSEFLYIVMQFQFFMKGKNSNPNLDPRWLSQESTKNALAKLNEVLSCLHQQMFVLKMTILYLYSMFVCR